MAFSFRSGALACLLFALAAAASKSAHADDYIRSAAPSPAAKAYFAAVDGGLPAKKVSRRDIQNCGGGEAYYTEDGAISIPPRAMVSFKMSGRCMDPHLPAPVAGEPMQFVDASMLIPPKLQIMYDNLIARQSRMDPRVLAANPQHLVWAIRTAGTDDPLANRLSDAQLEVLDECAGRRGAFLKYHEKEKKRNARKNRKHGSAAGGSRVSVGGFSYDASELSGTNGAQCVESHISALTEMGEKSKERTSSDFRYGEIEEELFSDVSCDGALSFKARILNASESRKEFRAADFAAQVGNGASAGSRRQRVTMGAPEEIEVVTCALRDGVKVDRDISVAEVEGEEAVRLRGRAYRRRTVRNGERHTRAERERHRDAPPVVVHDNVTNNVVRSIPVPESVSVRVVSLDYSAQNGKGVAVVEVVRGSFKEANSYIRDNLDTLVRTDAPSAAAATIPASARLEIESISISETDLCEVKFKAKVETEE